MNDRIRKYDKVTQVDASVVEKWQQVQIFNTEGLKAEDERFYTRLPTTVIAQDGSEQVESLPDLEASWAGNIKSHSIQKLIVSAPQAEALTMLKAEPCPAGKMPVVLDNTLVELYFMKHGVA